MLSQLEHIGRKIGRMREIFGGSEEADEARGNPRDLQARAATSRTRCAPYAGPTADEQSRIAAILTRLPLPRSAARS